MPSPPVMDDLRLLLARHEREVERLQQQCAARTASALRGPTSLHLAQLRKLHALLSRQRRHMEALEVLRTLEILEMREAHGQLERAEEENKAQLEALLQRHRRERQALEERLLQAQRWTGDPADLASAWAPQLAMQPRLSHRRLLPASASAQVAPEPPAGHPCVQASVYETWSEERCSWETAVPDLENSWAAADGDGEAAPLAEQQGLTSRGAALLLPAAGIDSVGQSTGVPPVLGHPPPPMHGGRGLGSLLSPGHSTPSGSPTAAVPGSSELEGAALNFDSSDWDVFCTLQQAAQEWHADPPHGATPSSSAESPLARRLAQLRGSPTTHRGSRHATAPMRRAGSAPVTPAGAGPSNRRGWWGSPGPLPSIYGSASPRRPGSCEAPLSGGGMQASWHASPRASGRGSQTAPPAGSRLSSLPAASHAQNLLPHLLSLLLSAGSQAVPPWQQHGGAWGWSSHSSGREQRLQQGQPRGVGSCDVQGGHRDRGEGQGGRAPQAASAADTAQPCGRGAEEAACARQELLPLQQPCTGAPQSSAAPPASASGGPGFAAVHLEVGGARRQPCAAAANNTAEVHGATPEPLPSQAGADDCRPPSHPPAGEAVAVTSSGADPARGARDAPGAPTAAIGGGQLLGVPAAAASTTDQQGKSSECALCSDGQEAAEAALLDHCRHGRYEEARQLLREAGLPVDTRDPDGNTPLMLASVGGHGRLVKLCLRKGAALGAQNAAGEHALLLAAATGHRAVAKHLLESGADPTLCDLAGRNAEGLIKKWAARAGPG